MLHLDDAQLFLRVAHAGSLTAAARELDITPAAASATLKRLETKLRVRLFERSTRAMHLTPEGELMRETCERLLAAWSDGQAQITAQHRDLVGPLRIAAPSDLTRAWLGDWAAEFAQAHPGVEIVMHVSDTMRELTRQPVDVALRYGEPPDSGMQARKLIDNQPVLVAAPDYLRHHGTPQTPQDLAQHRCLTFFLRQRPYTRWVFHKDHKDKGADGREIVVNVKSALCADDGAVVRQWALDGHGVVLKSRLDVWRDVQAGRLVALLPDYTTVGKPLYAVWPSPRHVPLRARRWVDFVEQRLRQAMG